MVRPSVADTMPSNTPARHPEQDLIVDAMRQRATAPVVESMVHDLRNPLNALSINLEVLMEKLRAETGEVPANQDKNVRAMREQIQRMDALLRRFSEFLLDRPRPAECVAFSTLLQASLEVLSPEVRRHRLKPQVALAAEVQVRGDVSALRFLSVQALVWSIARSAAGEELRVTLRAQGGEAVLEIDAAGGSDRPDEENAGAASPELETALQIVAARLGGRIGFEGGRCTAALPLAAS